jgi:hypothetical protein
VSALAALLLPPRLGVTLSMAAVGLGAGVPVVYSYLAWRREMAGR